MFAFIVNWEMVITSVLCNFFSAFTSKRQSSPRVRYLQTEVASGRNQRYCLKLHDRGLGTQCIVVKMWEVFDGNSRIILLICLSL